MTEAQRASTIELMRTILRLDVCDEITRIRARRLLAKLDPFPGAKPKPRSFADFLSGMYGAF